MANTITSERIVAVGYEIDFQAIADLLEQHRPGIKEILNHQRVHSGVYYSGSCRGVDREDVKSEEDLTTWFRRRVGKVTHGKLTTLHISRRQDLVIGEMRFGQDLIYTFILNTESKSTSQQKKLAYKKDPLFNIVTIPDTQVPCRPYMHVEVTTKKKEYWSDDDTRWYWREIEKKPATLYE